MADPQWKVVCLDTVKKNGWTLCDWNTVCLPLQPFIDGYCSANEKAPGTPVPQIQNGKVCYCCCSCFAYDTPIMVAEGVFAPIQDIEEGQTVLGAGVNLKWEPRTVTYSGGLGPDLTFDFMYHLSYKYEVGDELVRFMIVTPDHLYLMEDGKLKAVQTLVMGDKIRRADGGLSEVAFSARGSYTGGLHHITLGDFDGHNIDGHLINSNGVVCSDYIVQLAYSSGALDQSLISAPPAEEAAKALALNHAAVAFVNDRSQWPEGFTCHPIDSQFNIPLAAHRFLTNAQAADVLKNGVFSSPANMIALSQAQYLFTIYDALGPDLVFLNDWNNEDPNAYSWMSGGQRLVVITGGLLRLYGVSLEGLALILAHMVATQAGMECVGEADYEATYNYFRTFWPDTLYGNMIPPALAQVQFLFSLVDADNSGGNAERPCYDPSLDCRMKAFENGVAMMGVPQCALPKGNFGVTSATAATNLTRVNVNFSLMVNPPSSETAGNYSISKVDGGAGVVGVTAALLKRPVDKVVVLTVTGLNAKTKYRLTVKDVISADNQPLDPKMTSAEFTTP